MESLTEWTEKQLREDVNSHDFHYLWNIECWDEIFDFVVKSKDTRLLEEKKTQLLMLNAIMTRYGNNLDKNDITLFEERIAKVLSRLSLFEVVRLQFLSSVSSE